MTHNTSLAPRTRAALTTLVVLVVTTGCVTVNAKPAPVSTADDPSVTLHLTAYRLACTERPVMGRLVRDGKQVAVPAHQQLLPLARRDGELIFSHQGALVGVREHALARCRGAVDARFWVRPRPACTADDAPLVDRGKVVRGEPRELWSQTQMTVLSTGKTLMALHPGDPEATIVVPEDAIVPCDGERPSLEV